MRRFCLARKPTDRASLAELLALIFNYDAPTILQTPASHAVLIREGARDVIRELALAVLEGPAVDSERFKVIITGIKSRVPLQRARIILSRAVGTGRTSRWRRIGPRDSAAG